MCHCLREPTDEDGDEEPTDVHSLFVLPTKDLLAAHFHWTVGLPSHISTNMWQETPPLFTETAIAILRSAVNCEDIGSLIENLVQKTGSRNELLETQPFCVAMAPFYCTYSLEELLNLKETYINNDNFWKSACRQHINFAFWKWQDATL